MSQFKKRLCSFIVEIDMLKKKSFSPPLVSHVPEKTFVTCYVHILLDFLLSV